MTTGGGQAGDRAHTPRVRRPRFPPRAGHRPGGLAVGAAGAAALIADVPLLAAAAAVTVLSLGYDMTQPSSPGS